MTQDVYEPTDWPMNDEHKAWRVFCQEFDKLTGLSVNEAECQPMIACIRLWGEELVRLRESDPEHTENALAEARAEFSRLVQQ